MDFSGKFYFFNQSFDELWFDERLTLTSGFSLQFCHHLLLGLPWAQDSTWLPPFLFQTVFFHWSPEEGQWPCLFRKQLPSLPFRAGKARREQSVTNFTCQWSRFHWQKMHWESLPGSCFPLLLFIKELSLDRLHDVVQMGKSKGLQDPGFGKDFQGLLTMLVAVRSCQSQTQHRGYSQLLHK